MKLNKNKLLENRFGVIRGEGVVGWEKWGSLVGCRLWGRTESDMTEAT